jgi:hypothetical protein
MCVLAAVSLLACAERGPSAESSGTTPAPPSLAPATAAPTEVVLAGERLPVVPCSARRVHVRTGTHDVCVERATVEVEEPDGARILAQSDTRVVLGADGVPIGLELLRDRSHARARLHAGWIPLRETREPRARFEMGGASHPIVACRGSAPARVVVHGMAGGFCIEERSIDVDGRAVSGLELIANAPIYQATLAAPARVSGRDFPAGTRIAIGDAGQLLSATLVEPVEVAGITVPAGSAVTFGDEITIQLFEHGATVGGHRFRPDATLSISPEGRLRSAVFTDRQDFGGRRVPDAGDGIWHVEFHSDGRIAEVDCARC